jgi:DNA ligase-1
MISKPMLAATIRDTRTLPYPMIATPKIDGIRCLKRTGLVVSRSLKPIRNDFIRTTLERLLPEGADGEVFCGTTFQESTVAVMGRAGEPDFGYAMFDLVTDPSEPYYLRLVRLTEEVASIDDHRIVLVPWVRVANESMLLEYESRCLELGFEGVMLRTPNSPYKSGRATLSQGWLLKLKRFQDGEAEVIGFEEGQHNLNEGTRNALGLVQRSSAKAGKVPAGWLGHFKVRDLVSKVAFGIGNGEGLTLELRKEVWNDRRRHLGRVVKYRFQPVGTVDAPRFPQFLGFRDSDDQ